MSGPELHFKDLSGKTFPRNVRAVVSSHRSVSAHVTPALHSTARCGCWRKGQQNYAAFPLGKQCVAAYNE